MRFKQPIALSLLCVQFWQVISPSVTVNLQLVGQTPKSLGPFTLSNLWTSFNIPELVEGSENVECEGIELILPPNRDSSPIRIADVLVNPMILNSVDMSGRGLDEIPSLSEDAIGIASSLQVSANNLRIFPEDIISQAFLESIDATQNRLVSLPPLPQLLSSVMLAHNKFRMLPVSLVSLSALTTLDFSFNPIDTFPEAISKLSNLRNLQLNNCMLSDVPPSLFGMSNLLRLGLAGNPLDPSEDLFPVPEVVQKELERLEQHEQKLHEYERLLDIVSGQVVRFDAAKGRSFLERIQPDTNRQPYVRNDARNHFPAWNFTSKSHLGMVGVECLTGGVTVCCAIRATNNGPSGSPGTIVAPIGFEIGAPSLKTGPGGISLTDRHGLMLTIPDELDGDWHILTVVLHSGFKKGGAGVDYVFVDGVEVASNASQYCCEDNLTLSLFHSVPEQTQQQLWKFGRESKDGHLRIHSVGNGLILSTKGEKDLCLDAHAKNEDGFLIDEDRQLFHVEQKTPGPTGAKRVQINSKALPTKFLGFVIATEALQLVEAGDEGVILDWEIHPYGKFIRLAPIASAGVVAEGLGIKTLSAHMKQVKLTPFSDIVEDTFVGEVGEFFLFNHAMNDKDRRVVEQHLGLKWLSQEQRAKQSFSYVQSSWVDKVTGKSSEYNADTWSASQVAGKPKVYPRNGDIQGAWAPKQSTGSMEYIELQFKSAVKFFGFEILETYNPGAVAKVSVLDPNTGDWVPVYEAEAQNQKIGKETRVFRPSITVPSFRSNAVRLDLDCTKATSYSEIDAVRATTLMSMEGSPYEFKTFRLEAAHIVAGADGTGWFDTGIQVGQSQRFTVVGAGSWEHDNNYFDAAGRPLKEEIQIDVIEPEPVLRQFCLVGRIGSWIQPLSTQATVVAKEGGTLFLGCFNDKDPVASNGFINVGVTLRYAPPKNENVILSLTSLDLSGPPKFSKCLTTKALGLPATAKPIVSSAKALNLVEFKEYVRTLPLLADRLGGKQSEHNRRTMRLSVADQAALQTSELLSLELAKDSKTPADELFLQVDDNANGILEGDEITELEKVLTKFFPPRPCPLAVFALLNLKVLNLTNMGLLELPVQVKHLRFSLESLNLSFNPIAALPAELGLCQKLLELDLEGCHRLHTPPPEVIARGTVPILSYLKALSQEQEPVYRTKLMFVGLGGVGKTSVCKSLTGKTYEAKSTDGIDVDVWLAEVGADECVGKPEMNGKTIHFQLFDFAGQEVYYTTHALFLSSRAIYLVIWNVRLGWVHSGVEYWLRSIRSHAPSATVIIVGTHCDQVPHPSLPEDVLKEKFPQIKAFIGVATGGARLNMDYLRRYVLNSAVNETYMGEQRPKAWLDLERQLVERRMSQDYMNWETFMECCQNVAIFDPDTASQASSFLHDLGAIIHHNDAEARLSGLSDLIILNPQWLADVCRCIITAQESHVDNGVLDHALLPRVWAAFKPDLYDKLLELLQKFELIRRLPNEKKAGGSTEPESILSGRSLVPSLLPEQPPPSLDVPKFSHPTGTYTFQSWFFSFLPSGAFARVQVRLQQLSSSALTSWRYGVLLEKNGHAALVQHYPDEMKVTATVLGPEPANLLSIVHFAINGLRESFAGLDFDVYVPCPVCVTKRNKDADLFSLKQSIRRANELGVQYLQCRSYFHQIPTTSFLAELPASSPEDHHIRMEAALQAVRLLKKALQTPFYISYNKASLSDQKAAMFVRSKLRDKDIQAYMPVAGETDLDVDIAALNSAQYFVLIISEEYSTNNDTVSEVTYIKKQLKRPVIPIPTAEYDKWIQSQVGMLVGNLLWIQYSETDPAFVDQIVSRCKKYLTGDKEEKTDTVHHKAMLSYCWANSNHALQHKQVTRVIGYADPREIKNKLADGGMSTWLDIENLGYESDKGLFDGILEGLKNAQVVVACVSNQYAASANCRMEFTYALKMLRKPVIVAVVGANDGSSMWEESEVGLLSNFCPFFGTRCPMVDFRSVYDEESFAAKVSEIETLCRDALTQLENRTDSGIVEEKVQDTAAATADKAVSTVQAFREQTENIRRSFLLALGGETGVGDAPRLFVVVPNGIRLVCEHIGGFHIINDANAHIALSAEDLDELLKDTAVTKYQDELWEVLDTVELDGVSRKQLEAEFGPQISQMISKFGRQRDAGAGLSAQGLQTILRLWRRVGLTQTQGALTQIVLPTKERMMLCDHHFTETRTNASASSFFSRS
eukprot:c12444_g1_i2.p1 GENE.c12444_g1_i2~~c12444_g1_i2.p1  ORF type:complete len:2218 (+),score=558.81 c12444_g1_i2:626-7279(+)